MDLLSNSVSSSNFFVLNAMEHLGSVLEVKVLVPWCLTEIPRSEVKDGFLHPAMSST